MKDNAQSINGLLLMGLKIYLVNIEGGEREGLCSVHQWPFFVGSEDPTSVGKEKDDAMSINGFSLLGLTTHLVNIEGGKEKDEGTSINGLSLTGHTTHLVSIDG